MANPQTPMKTFRHYFYDEASDFAFYTEEFPDDLGTMVHIGDSDNPKPASAMAAFLQDGKVNTGYKLRNLDTQ
jgi:hypothetical protein